jgi:carboxyl-terminal processing protease
MKKIILFSFLSIFSFSLISQVQNENEQYFEISKNLTLFSEVYKNINLNFVDETNPGELMKTGIDAMLKSLDPYTNYIPESNIEDYRMMQSGQYGGIGSLIQKREEYIMITNPYENFPAQKAGIKAGDKIINIDGKSVVGKSADEVSELLKGAKNTEVILTIKRTSESNPIEVKITRELIKIPTVPYYSMLNDKVGYIKLTQFLGTSSSEFTAAFKELKDSNELEGLVLDLRGNPGGLLNESVNIVNLFVPKGTKVVETKGRDKKNNFTYVAKNKPMDTKIPLVVLIDEGSASASEIVSGALQDLDRAVVVGNQSFGKGLVQQQINMEYNSMIKITIAKYYTPSGRCIQKLDYSDRNTSGEGSSISDSLVNTFTTKNGRPVTDGRGVSPDIEIERKPLTPISIALLRENIIFDFATEYYYSNSSISKASDFLITEADYKEFIAFALKREFKYSTGSEKVLQRLKKIAEDEQYYESSELEFEALVEKLSPNKNRDLVKFEEEIKRMIESDIVTRYYYQTGQMENDLKHDECVIKAIEIINNSKEYSLILIPKK